VSNQVPPGAPSPRDEKLPDASTAQPTRRRPGRRPLIDRDAIARAASEIPRQDLTPHSVAARLGVSVHSLYRYVRRREDIIRIATAQSALRLAVPADQGQHWAAALYEWADFTRRIFAGDPELLKDTIDGTIGLDAIAGHLDKVMGLCMRQGFTAIEAFQAFQLISECALGAAIDEIRGARARPEDLPFHREVRSLIARGNSLPHLAQLAGASPFSGHVPFRRQLTTVLVGIAAQRGEPWERIEALLPPPADD
jgi:hypothetical protein